MNALRKLSLLILCFCLLITTFSTAQPPIDPLAAALDIDRDGTVSSEEIDQAPATLMALDKNSDGRLTLDEIAPGFSGPFGPPGFGPPGFGPPGFGGRGPRMEKREIVSQFDSDGNGRLNREERSVARESLEDDGNDRGPFVRGGRGPGGRGPGRRGRGGPGGSRDPATPGPRISENDVQVFPDAALYDPAVLRTLFLEFEHDDWNEEMAAFKDTDVDIAAKLTVDGRVYPNVGVHFRGMSSFGMVPEDYKRSLNLSLDFVDGEQRLDGYRTLNLLNCAGDASMMSTVLYSHIASPFLPVPKANFVRVVINGESWGVYANLQQVNKDFLREHYGTRKGVRWKVRGNPGADAGLRYFGEDIAEYRKHFQMKSAENEHAWIRLIELCRILEQTSPDDLESALEPILNVDQVLWFLAMDVASVNSDGYWTRASDYYLYLDTTGRFNVIPGDINEAFHSGSRGPGGPPGGFRPPGVFGPPPIRFNSERDPSESFDVGAVRGRRGGFGGPPGHGSVELDPLVNADNPRMPLRMKLLAVPRLRQQYLQNIRSIALAMDWKTIGPFVRANRTLIEQQVKADTRKLTTYDAFSRATRDEVGEGEDANNGLRYFFEARSEFLLQHPEVARLPDVQVHTPTPTRDDLAGRLVINELMAANDSIRDPDGQFDDWIELLNRSDHEIDLSDVALSDNTKQLRKWTFPPGTRIGPGKLLMVWADDDTDSQYGLHAGFKLSKSGETLTLSRRDGARDMIIDQVRFGQQRVGVSFGRPNAESTLPQQLAPTPGEPNRAYP